MTVSPSGRSEAIRLRSTLQTATLDALLLARLLQLAADDCWADENTVRLTPEQADMRELLLAISRLQAPLAEIRAASSVDP